MVYAIGAISGCHINPAISISMLVAGKLSVKDTAFYVVFQCVGAIIGAGILYAIAMGSPSFNAAKVWDKTAMTLRLQLVILWCLR